jgi:hypothetical protein
MRWIDTTDLKNWAPHRDCQDHLPLVIRRLIRATVKDVSHIHFPAGDAVVYAGWDGILEASAGTEYIPEGASRWEISSSQDIKGKAEEDYQKRKENPLRVEPSNTTYIAVTPLVWTGKHDWCNEKKNDGFWKDVRAYDATILEEWLEQAPAVGTWLARYLGKAPQTGVQALEDYWTEWSGITRPNLTPELVLAGRARPTEDVRKWLMSEPKLLTVRATTRREITAFIAAVICSFSEAEREFWFSRSIVVENIDSFRHIEVTIKTSTLLITGFKEVEATVAASHKGHHVCIPIEPHNMVVREDITLLRLGREEFISALTQMGLSEDDAKKYSKETGRSLTVLRRRLMDIKDQPEWAKPNNARDLVAVILAQQWSEKKEADKEIVGKLARKDYDSYSGILNSCSHQPDSTILKIGDLWRLLSPLDAWFAIAPYITDTDMQLFHDVVDEVLGCIDPALELDPEERWMAQVRNKVLPHSHSLREGITQSLVLMSVFGEEPRMQVSETPKAWVDEIIGRLLHEASPELWHSLSDVLPIIAEASPDSFLDAVESSLSQDKPSIMNLFVEIQGPVFLSSSHSELLWALEGLAWSPDLLPRVTLILGKLARLDPGGELANRPESSLRYIYLLWLPQTNATLEQRMQVIDVLMEREPEVGWNLLIALAPRQHDVSFPRHKPRWREFPGKSEVEVPYHELFLGINQVTERLLVHVGTSGKRWTAVMEGIANFLPDGRQKIIEQLSSDVHRIDDGPTKLWAKLREILSHHRSYPDTKWALPEQELKEIENVYDALKPQDVIERFSWLFDAGWFDLPEGNQDRNWGSLEPFRISDFSPKLQCWKTCCLQ